MDNTFKENPTELDLLRQYSYRMYCKGTNMYYHTGPQQPV